MLMVVFVAYVDNCLDRKERITFVNKKQGIESRCEPRLKHAVRDFGIRRELCNFAQKFEMCA